MDKLHIAANIINKEKDKAVIYKNLFVSSKGEKFFKNREIIKELTTWEDRPTSIQPTSKRSNGGDGNFSALQEDSSFLPSQNSPESQGKFSAIDSDFEERKRKIAIELAAKIYEHAGKNFDPATGSSAAFIPTEEQIQDIYMSDMSILEDDMEEIASTAEAIAYKMASRGGKIKNIREEARRIEDEFSTAKIVEACIKEAQRKWQKDLQASEKMKELERRSLEAQKRGVIHWNADELSIDNINLLDAVAGGANAEEEIQKLLEKCKRWADQEGVSYDLMLEKFKATLGANYEEIASRFVRYKHIRSALSGIRAIIESESEERASKRAERLSAKLKEYLNRELSAFEEKKQKEAEKADARKKKKAEKDAEKRLKKAHAKAVSVLLKFARSQKLPTHSELEIKRKLPARIQAYLAQIKKRGSF